MMFRMLSFRGRTDRSAFVMITLILLGLTYLAGGMLCVSLDSLGTPLPPEDVPPLLAPLRLPVTVALLGSVLALASLLFVLIGTLAVCVRRLHDAGQSGLLVLLFIILPMVIPDIPWSNFIPPPLYFVWNVLMLALPRACTAIAKPSRD